MVVTRMARRAKEASRRPRSIRRGTRCWSFDGGITQTWSLFCVATVLVQILLVATRPCHSFSASVFKPPRLQPRPLLPYDRDNNPRQQSGKNRNPTTNPLSFPAWNQDTTTYLRQHQSRSRRKSLGRLLEIGTVLSGQIVRPLLCSLATTPRFQAPDTEFNWDAFWRETRIEGKLSNAQRVAEGLPRLGICFSKLGQILATRPDVLHADLADALANLQDNMRPFDNQTAQRIVRRDLSALLRQTAADNKSQRTTTAALPADPSGPGPILRESLCERTRGRRQHCPSVQGPPAGVRRRGRQGAAPGLAKAGRAGRDIVSLRRLLVGKFKVAQGDTAGRTAAGGLAAGADRGRVHRPRL